MWQHLLQEIMQGNVKALSRCISLIENEVSGYEDLLQQLPVNNAVKIIGITGPPGAGKSTLTDALINLLINDGKRIAVLCVDPSSPFNMGALLGDRIRMSEWYTNSNVFIRSLATRGSLGGLHPKIIEITDLIKAAGFDHVIVETVGVGQSEIEIAGLADVTVVVLVPESGDDVQIMKAGLMEVADIFVINKSDRPGSGLLEKSLLTMLAPVFSNHTNEIFILKTIASERKGIEELMKKILLHFSSITPEKKYQHLAEKAFYLIQNKRMKDVNKKLLRDMISLEENFNLYKFLSKHF